MTLEECVRWDRLWCFLSLDMTASFSDELWLDRLSQAQLRHIRSSIHPETDLPTYGSDPRSKVYDRLRDFSAAFAPDELRRLLWWQRYVYIPGGTDRSSEFFWMMMTAGHSDWAPTQSDASRALIAVQRDRLVHKRRIAAKRASQTQPSEWDAVLIEAEGSSIAEVLLTIQVIADANSFSEAWHSEVTRKGPTFLTDLFNLVTETVPSNALQFEPETIPFPSSWEFGLQLYGRLTQDNLFKNDI